MEPVKPARNWGGNPPAQVEARPQCQGTNVQAHREIYINGHDHAGLVTHRCRLEEHEDTSCQCGCGHIFTKPFKTIRP